MIRFEHVTKRMGGKRVLDEVEMEIRDGETFVIVGASGAGKSVCLRHMVRLLTPDEGRVLVGDRIVSEARGTALREIRAQFGFLFQEAALMDWMSVESNVAMPLRQRQKLTDKEIDERVGQALQMVSLEDARQKLPSELSGGMQKRVGLARAIVTDPRYVLYDEPTAGLDPVTSRTIDHLVNRLRSELSVTSVVVTHDLLSALAVGTRIALLHEGRLDVVCEPAAFVVSDDPTVRRFLDAQRITADAVPQDEEEA